jgi:amino-acid N-acetyltransferase
MSVQPATAQDAAAIKRLLDAAGLPTADLEGRWLERFLVARDDAQVVGAVGLDLAGDVGLLRSLVVADGPRRRGLGQELVLAAENRARQRGAKALFLLTTTAAEFFKRRGYAEADRAIAPDAIRQMPQFATLCPASSTFMAKIDGALG